MEEDGLERCMRRLVHGGETALTNAMFSHCLRPMIDRLSADYRDAIKLVELEGLTNQEAANKLGLSISGMKSRVQRGRQQFRKMLDECCLIELDRRRRIRRTSAGLVLNRVQKEIFLRVE